jgi:hypothetical protein
MFRKNCRENQTHFMFNKVSFFSKSRRLWDYVEKYDTAWLTSDGDIIWRMFLTCWESMVIDTHSGHVTLIAFPQRRRLNFTLCALCLSCTLRPSWDAPKYSLVRTFWRAKSSWQYERFDVSDVKKPHKFSIFWWPYGHSACSLFTVTIISELRLC